MWIALRARRSKSQIEVSDYVNRYIKPRLSALPGAADVRIFGERKISMRIVVDRAQLAGYRLTPQDVEDALPPPERGNPGGAHRAARANSRWSRKPTCRPPSSSTIDHATSASYPVRIRDVGRVEVAPSTSA